MIDRKKLRESLTSDHIIYLMRLLGATDGDSYAMMHAKELLNQSELYKARLP
jgi:hypothetical protein